MATVSCKRILTELLTPCSTVLEKLTSLQLVNIFPACNGTWRFITTFTSFCHLSLSWARSIQSIPPHPTFWKSTLILSYHLCLDLSIGLFPSGFPTCEYIITKIHFHSEELLAPRPTPKLKDHPLSALGDCLSSIFPVALHIGSCSSVRNEDVPCRGDRDPLLICGKILNDIAVGGWEEQCSENWFWGIRQGWN
jgi:hypothetical protein